MALRCTLLLEIVFFLFFATHYSYIFCLFIKQRRLCGRREKIKIRFYSTRNQNKYDGHVHACGITLVLQISQWFLDLSSYRTVIISFTVISETIESTEINNNKQRTQRRSARNILEGKKVILRGKFSSWPNRKWWNSLNNTNYKASNVKKLKRQWNSIEMAQHKQFLKSHLMVQMISKI